MFHQPTTTLHFASMKRHRHWGLCTALCKSRQLSLPQAHRGHAHRAAQSLRHAPSGVGRKKRVDLSDATQISSAQTMNLPALGQLRCIEQGLQRAMSGSICIRALTGSNAVRYSTYLSRAGLRAYCACGLLVRTAAAGDGRSAGYFGRFETFVRRHRL